MSDLLRTYTFVRCIISPLPTLVLDCVFRESNSVDGIRPELPADYHPCVCRMCIEIEMRGDLSAEPE